MVPELIKLGKKAVDDPCYRTIRNSLSVALQCGKRDNAV
jgi:hypothetical protein